MSNEDQSDYALAEERLKENNPRIPLEDVEKYLDSCAEPEVDVNEIFSSNGIELPIWLPTDPADNQKALNFLNDYKDVCLKHGMYLQIGLASMFELASIKD